MAHTLIVFYSRTGTTRRVAEQLAISLDAHVMAIEEPRRRRGLLGYLRSIREAVRGTLPRLSPPTQNPAEYDLVVLGTPVWAGHVASPMRSFLQGHRATLQRIAFFCTCGSRGAERTFQDMQHLAGRPPEATCALTAADLRSGKSDLALASFVHRLAAPEPAVRRRKTRGKASADTATAH